MPCGWSPWWARACHRSTRNEKEGSLGFEAARIEMGPADLAAGRIFVGRISNVDRLLQIEIKFGFGWDADLLAFGGRFGRGASASSDAGADANRLSSALAARLADVLIVVTRERIRLALEVQAGQL